MPTILIIDDEKGLCTVLEDLFSSEGFRVLVAHDGDQGVRIARARNPDIILSDIRMPGISGHEAVQQFRAIPTLTATPVIMFTANAGLDDMRKSMEAGADDYLSKPVDLDALLRTINQHLERSVTRRDALRLELIRQRANTGAILPIDLIDPLHEIIGCASVLMTDASMMTPAEVGEFSRNIISGAETLNQRFENFILYSRIQADILVVPPPRSTDLAELVTDTVRKIAERHNRTKGIRLKVEPATATVSADFLAKALTEIVDNACRYSLATEPIDIGLQCTETTFEISVRDYGNGLGQDQMDRFEKESVEKGCGLLLSRRLTEALGGVWNLDNQPKQGATITLSLPLPNPTS